MSAYARWPLWFGIVIIIIVVAICATVAHSPLEMFTPWSRGKRESEDRTWRFADEDLRRLERATLRRLESRRQAVQEWIAQRRTLTETMQEFQELEDEWPPPDLNLLRKKWPSDEARHYGLIQIYVEVILHERPEELAAALRRLESDYRKL